MSLSAILGQAEVERQAELASAIEAMRDRERAGEERAHEASLDMHGKFLDMVEGREQALQSLIDKQSELARSSLDMSASVVAAFDNLEEGLVAGLDILVHEFGRVRQSVKDFEDAGGSAADGFKAAVPGMLTASGKLVAGFIDDEQAKAGILFLAESAAAVASFAKYDYVGGAMHAAAATMYGAIASGFVSPGPSGGGGGAGGRTRSPAPRVPDVSRPQQQQAEGGITLVANFSGATIIGGDRKRVGRDLIRMMGEEMRSRSGNSTDFLPA